MSLRRYLELLRVPSFGYLMSVSLLARLPYGMVSLAIALLVSRHGAYARAGFVISANVIGAALSGPLMGRAVDRFGRAQVLRPAALLCTALLCTLAVLPVRDVAALTVCAFGAGLALPPMASAARSLWTEVVPPELQAAVYSLEATLQELIFILGPALVALLAALASPRLALIASGVAATVGVFAFCAHGSVANPAGAPGGRRSHRPAAPMSLLFTAVLVVGAFTVVELATVALTRAWHAPAAAGVILAGWAFGSFVAGLAWGTRVSSPDRPARRLAGLVGMVAVGVAVPALALDLPMLGGLLFLGGLTIAPAFGALYGLVAASARADARAEAFGWLSGGFQVGAAAGAAVGGVVVQHLGPRPGYAIAAAAVLLAPGLLLARDQRTRVLEPLPVPSTQ